MGSTRGGRKSGEERKHVKKTIMMAFLVAVMVSLFAAVAYAAIIRGTGGADFLHETPKNDEIYGFRGPDTLDGDWYSQDTDKLHGGRGGDRLNADDGDPRDILDGGRGDDDVCFGDNTDFFTRCELVQR